MKNLEEQERKRERMLKLKGLLEEPSKKHYDASKHVSLSKSASLATFMRTSNSKLSSTPIMSTPYRLPKLRQK
jgi:hypothetical protein